VRRLGSVVLVALGSSLSVSCASGDRSQADLKPLGARPDPDGDTLSEPEEYRDQPVSVEAGERYFHETGMGDPYAAGIPYPIFLAMMDRFPDELGKDFRAFNQKFGTLENPKTTGEAAAVPVGFHRTVDPLTRVEFLVLNCQICHAARIVLPDGPRVVPGLGNKGLRIHAYDRALTRIENHPDFTPEKLLGPSVRAAQKLGLRWPVDIRRAVLREATRKMKERAAGRTREVEQLGDGLPGRVATIEGFMLALNQQHGTSLALPKVTGWARVPDVIGWRHRDTISYDAISVGDPVTLVAEADFAFGVRHAWFETHRHIPTSMHLYLRQFQRALEYPRAIDSALAARGHALFEKRCGECHGSYGAPGAAPQRVSYHEKIVHRSIIKTDAARLDAVTPEFIEVVNGLSQTRGLVRSRKTDGYVPPVLIDVWARAPYGHNGQWPDLQVLAQRPEERPRTFLVELERPYDLERVGVPSSVLTDKDGTLVRADQRPPAPAPGSYVYDGRKSGFDVRGHPFLSDLERGEQRAIIEYLKTL
jgi:hypothetical protein